MKKSEFLAELVRKKKLMEVESSENIKNSYIKKSESSIISAKILFENDRLEESVALAYYSMYHSVTALFFKVGIKCENHSVAITLLKDIFNINNDQISYAKSERVDKQYYTDFNVTKEQVKESIIIAEEFNSSILNFIARLNNLKISEYQNKFRELIKQLI